MHFPCLCFFVSALFCYALAHTLAIDVSSLHVHGDEWHLTVLVATLHAPRLKSVEVLYQLRSTPSSKCTRPQENSLATGGCFERNTYRVTALGWLKKEDEQC